MREICQQCKGRGAGTMNYHSGEPFNVWLCGCQTGMALRREIDEAPERLSARFGVPLERIWPLEQLQDDAEPSPITGTTTRDILVSAGKVDRAGLGGKVKKR